MMALAAASPAPPPAFKAAVTLADSGPAAGVNDELRQAICLELIRRGEFETAQTRAAALPGYGRAAVWLELAAALPAERRAEAEQLVAAAQHDGEVTVDWHRSRVSRSLAVARAKLGQFDAAAKAAGEVPDAEDRAFALREVVVEFCRRGEVARARELAETIEENRRYGTYRQKAGALAAVARALHGGGDHTGAAALLTRAESLLPKKPGWSDGGALLEVAVAVFECGQAEHGRELLGRAETLALGIAGAWRVSELCAVANAWRESGEAERANGLLREAEVFVAALSPTERAPESLVLARALHAANQTDAARKVLASVLSGATDRREVRARALLAWAELFGNEAVPKPAR